MKNFHHLPPVFILSLLLPFLTQGREPSASRSDTLWASLAPYCTPPTEYAGRYGDYRSPLRFYDGTPVKKPTDWQRRREEIRERWMTMMGPWPPPVKRNEMTILDTLRKERYAQHRVRLRWTPGEETEGYLLLPYATAAGHRTHPAVITVFYEPETSVGIGGKPHRDFGRLLADRGFVVLSVGTARATREKTYSLFYPDIDSAVVEPLSMLACAAANALGSLALRPEVDPDRIGIAGHSFGGKWAMFASCLCDGFACAAWSDPGIVFDESKSAVNYWEPYYLGYVAPPWRKRGDITPENPACGLYPRLVREGYDLHELHALMAPRPFLVSGGSCDPAERWIALNHTIAVNRLLGFENRVLMTNRPEHSPNAESNEILCWFFEYFLRPTP